MAKQLLSDSDKIELIPEMMSEVARLNKILITGAPEADEPGLLENVRNIRKDIREIKESQPYYFTLEKRVENTEKAIVAINLRNEKIDKENESGIERRKKRVDAMAIAVFSMIVSNIGIIVMIWLGAR